MLFQTIPGVEVWACETESEGAMISAVLGRIRWLWPPCYVRMMPVTYCPVPPLPRSLRVFLEDSTAHHLEKFSACPPVPGGNSLNQGRKSYALPLFPPRKKIVDRSKIKVVSRPPDHFQQHIGNSKVV